MAVAFLKSELDKMLYDLSEQYLVEVKYKSGGIKRQLVHIETVKNLKLFHDKADSLPKNVKAIHYYKVCLTIKHKGSETKVKRYLQKLNLNKIPIERFSERGEKKLISYIADRLESGDPLKPVKPVCRTIEQVRIVES